VELARAALNAFVARRQRDEQGRGLFLVTLRDGAWKIQARSTLGT
jgi:hypothetical protein